MINVEGVIKDKEIIEDDNKAVSDKIEEASCEIPEYLNEVNATTAVGNMDDDNEASFQQKTSKINNVTSVTNDCDHVQKHFVDGQEAPEADNDVLDENSSQLKQYFSRQNFGKISFEEYHGFTYGRPHVEVSRRFRDLMEFQELSGGLRRFPNRFRLFQRIWLRNHRINLPPLLGR